MSTYNAQAVQTAQNYLALQRQLGNWQNFSGRPFRDQDEALHWVNSIRGADAALFRLENSPQGYNTHQAAWTEFDRVERLLLDAVAAVRTVAALLPEVPEEEQEFEWPVPNKTCVNIVRVNGDFLLKYMRGYNNPIAEYNKKLGEYRRLLADDGLAKDTQGRWCVKSDLISLERIQYWVNTYETAIQIAVEDLAVDKAAWDTAVHRLQNWDAVFFRPMYDALCRAYGSDRYADALPSAEVQRLVNQANAAAEDWRRYVVSRMTYVISPREPDTNLDFVVREAERLPCPADAAPW